MSIVESFSRLHIGLLDLANATPRKYGGAGFTLSGPSVIVQAIRSRRTGIDHSGNIDTRAAGDLELAVQRLQKVAAGSTVCVQVLRMVPQHVGLGSKTALVLATLKAIDLECSLNLSRETLQLLSGRGGTSGIGINAFFDGGFLVDAGHVASRSSQFYPSSHKRRFDPPPVALRYLIPSEWRFHLLLPARKIYSAGAEVSFFKINTPTTKPQALRSISVMYHAIAPAILGGDLAGLRSGLIELHGTGFKSREVRSQSSTVKALLREIAESTVYPAGLSSMGPLVYAVASADDIVASSTLRDMCGQYGAKYLGSFAGRNSGWQILE